ncbi:MULTISPECIES: hypothetical protein [unclassified Kribbella]|uniref:hypothetical protein n=1 Tax=unclassified Kribbella TaxID=2644121 RepID=UPI0033E4EFD6
MVENRWTAEAFGRLAVELYDIEGLEETADAVVQFALQAVGCDYASVVLVAAKQRPEIMALTDPRLAELYQLQIDAAAGPLITVIRKAQPLLIRELVDTRELPARRTSS